MRHLLAQDLAQLGREMMENMPQIEPVEPILEREIEPMEPINMPQIEPVEPIIGPQIEPVEPINVSQIEPVEPINEPPPQYFEHEFMFQDDNSEASNDPPPAYTVPYIDRPDYRETENTALVPTPQPRNGPERPHQHPIFRSHGLRNDGKFFHMGNGKRAKECKNEFGFVDVVCSRGRLCDKRQFMWECMKGRQLRLYEEILTCDYGKDRCDINDMELKIWILGAIWVPYGWYYRGYVGVNEGAGGKMCFK